MPCRQKAVNRSHTRVRALRRASVATLTFGLSTLIPAGTVTATGTLVRKLVKEAGEEAAGCIMSTLTEPAVQAIENVAADLAVQAAANAVGLQNGIDTGQAVHAGKEGFQDGVAGAKEGLRLASVDGGPPPGSTGRLMGDLKATKGFGDHRAPRRARTTPWTSPPVRCCSRRPSWGSPASCSWSWGGLIRARLPTVGNLDAAVNSSGSPVRFTCDADGRVTSWTDCNDATFRTSTTRPAGWCGPKAPTASSPRPVPMESRNPTPGRARRARAAGDPSELNAPWPHSGLALHLGRSGPARRGRRPLLGLRAVPAPERGRADLGQKPCAITSVTLAGDLLRRVEAVRSADWIDAASHPQGCPDRVWWTRTGTTRTARCG